MLRILVIACLILSVALVAVAQQTPKAVAERHCNAAPFREFDFMIGDWVVIAAHGDTLGYNVISPVSPGCGLHEEWTGNGGSVATSLSYYDPSDQRWHQDWVGGTGMILHLSGGLEGSAMVLEGNRIGRQGPIIDRVTWTPLPDGRVHQVWDYSPDEGVTWRPIFDGFYERRQ
jgi:hypothetical protein